MGTISNTDRGSKKGKDNGRKTSKNGKAENRDECKDFQELWQRIYGPCKPVIMNPESKKGSEQGSTTSSEEKRNKGKKSVNQSQSHGKGSAGSSHPPTSSRNQPADDTNRPQARQNDLPKGWECAGYYVFPSGGGVPMFKYSSGDQKPAPVCPQFCLPQGYVDLCGNNQGDSSEESSSDTSESSVLNGNDKKGGVKNQATGTGGNISTDKKELGKTAKKSTGTKDPEKNDQKTTEMKELKKTDKEASKENIKWGNQSPAQQGYPPAPPSSSSSETPSSTSWSSSSGHSSASKNNFQAMYQQQTPCPGNMMMQPPSPGNMMHACMGTYPQSTQAMQATAVQLPAHWPPKPGPEFSSSPKDDEGLNFKFKPRPDFATEVTFTIEPKKTPMWQKMMRCGFRPMITCSAPPFNLPSNFDQAKKKCSGENSSEESSSGDSTSGSDSSGSDSDDSDITHSYGTTSEGHGNNYLSDSNTGARNTYSTTSTQTSRSTTTRS